jgi:hypothetical protein
MYILYLYPFLAAALYRSEAASADPGGVLGLLDKRRFQFGDSTNSLGKTVPEKRRGNGTSRLNSVLLLVYIPSQ